MSKKPIVLAVGSTVFDIVFGSRDVDVLGDVKDNADIAYMATGGGGANFAIALRVLKAHTQTPMHIILGTRLGIEPNGDKMQHMAREQIHGELEGIRIIDAIYENPFKIPVNNVNLTRKSRHIFTQFGPAASCIADGMEQQFIDTAAKASLVFLNTRLPVLTALTGKSAFENNVPVLLDYSVENPENSPFDMSVLERATYVFAPGEARVKGMPEFDKNDDEATRKNAELLFENSLKWVCVILQSRAVRNLFSVCQTAFLSLTKCRMYQE